MAGTDDQVRRILKNLSCQVSSGISKFVQTWVDFQDTLHLFGSLTIALDSENAAVYIGHIIKREQKNNESGVQSEGNREPVLRKEDAQEPIPQIGVQSKGNGEPVLRKEEDKEPIQPTGVQSEGNREPVLGKEEIKEPIQPKGVQEILFSSATADKNTEEENLGVDRTEDSQERIPLDDTHFPAELVSCVIPLLEGVSSQGERCTLEGYLTFSTAGISTSLYLKTETGEKCPSPDATVIISSQPCNHVSYVFDIESECREEESESVPVSDGCPKSSVTDTCTPSRSPMVPFPDTPSVTMATRSASMATDASQQSPDTPSVTMATRSASMTTESSQQSNLGAPTTSESSSIREAAPQLASSVFTETPQSSTLKDTTPQPASGLHTPPLTAHMGKSPVNVFPQVTSDVRTTPKNSPSTKTVQQFAVSASLAESIVEMPPKVMSDVRTSPKTSPKTKTVSQHTISAENVTRTQQTVSDGKVTSLQHSKTPGRVDPCDKRLEPTDRKLELRGERSEVEGEMSGESQENDQNLPASVQVKSLDKTIDLFSAVPEQEEVPEKQKASSDRSELPQSVHHNISSPLKIIEGPSTLAQHVDAPEASEISNEELPGFLLLSSGPKRKVQCKLCKKTMFSTSASNHRLLHERRGEAFPETDPRPLGDLPGSSTGDTSRSSKGDLSRSFKGDPSRSSEAGSEERVYMRTRSGSIIKTTSTILSSPDAKSSSGTCKTKEVAKDSHNTISTSTRRKSLRMIKSRAKTTSVIAKNTKLDNHKIDNEDCNDVNDDKDEVTVPTEKEKVGDKEPSLPWPRDTEHSKGRRTILKEKMRNSLKRGRRSSEKVEGATHSVTRISTRNSVHVNRPTKLGQNGGDESCDEPVVKRSKKEQDADDESEASKGQRKCKICQKKLNSNEAQLRHNVLEHGADPASLITPDMTILHKCNTCDIVYPHLSMLLEHKEREKHFLKIFLKKVEKGEQGSDPLQEDVSAGALKDSVATYIEETNNPLREKFIRDLEAAKLGEGQKPVGLRPRKFFQCKLGDYKPVPSNRLYALRAHILQVHLKTKPLKCEYCNHRSVDEYSLSVHMRTHTGEKNFMCAVCKKCFSLRRTCQKHQRDDHGMKISAKLSVTKRAVKPNHKRKKQNCDNVCEKCGRHFLTSNFYLHRKYCQLNLTFACDQCDKVYKTKQGLDRHVKVDHGAVKEQYVCDVCKRSFKYRATVVEHMRMYHLERPIKCEHCDASFIKQSSLDEHLRKHLGKRPFRCELCDKSFVRKTLLLRHKESHLTERNVVCDVCDKAFKSKTSLQQHKKIHSTEKKYRCDICDARFSLHGTYFIHMKRHRGQKDHKCRFCNMAFVTSGDRIRHEKTHTKEAIDKNGETPLSISFKNGKKAKLQQVEMVTAFDDLVVNTIILPVEGATSVDEPTQDASEKEVGEILYVVSGQHDIVGGATEISVPRVDSEGGVEEIVYVMSGPQEGPVITLP